LDKALPHLRAAAGIYADALADGMRLYFEDEAFDKWKAFFKTIPPSSPTANPPSFTQGRHLALSSFKILPQIDESSHLPVRRRKARPPHADASELHLISFRPPRQAQIQNSASVDVLFCKKSQTLC